MSDIISIAFRSLLSLPPHPYPSLSYLLAAPHLTLSRHCFPSLPHSLPSPYVTPSLSSAPRAGSLHTAPLLHCMERLARHPTSAQCASMQCTALSGTAAPVRLQFWAVSTLPSAVQCFVALCAIAQSSAVQCRTMQGTAVMCRAVHCPN